MGSLYEENRLWERGLNEDYRIMCRRLDDRRREEYRVLDELRLRRREEEKRLADLSQERQQLQEHAVWMKKRRELVARFEDYTTEWLLFAWRFCWDRIGGGWHQAEGEAAEFWQRAAHAYEMVLFTRSDPNCFLPRPSNYSAIADRAPRSRQEIFGKSEVDLPRNDLVSVTQRDQWFIRPDRSYRSPGGAHRGYRRSRARDVRPNAL